jgi:hypothetical protein
MATLTIIVPDGTPSIIFDGETYTSNVTAGVVKNQSYNINSSDGTSNFWYWSGTGINLPAANSQNTVVFVTGNTATLEVNYLNQPTATPVPPTPTSTPTPTATPVPTATPAPTSTPTPTPTISGPTFSGYTYVLQCNSGALTNGDLFLFSNQMSTITYNPAAAVADGIIAFSVYDNDDIDRTSFYSTLTGTTTLRMTQGGNSVTFAVSSGAFMYQSSGQQLFLYDGAGFGDGKLTVTSQTGGAFTCGDPMTIEIGTNQGSGGSGSGAWYFYSDEGSMNAPPPTSDGNAVFTINAGAQTETFNPNKSSGVSYLYFNVKDSTGTDYTSQFSGYTGGTGTITISQNGDTATYTSTTFGSFAIQNLGSNFFVISTAACTQTKSSNAPFVYADPISITFGS